MKPYQTKTLPSGLRVIVLQSSSPVVYCGLAVGAGTRHEQSGEEGLAHFCEHLTFKGTRRRSALQIINAIEGVGGELNAFTGKEDTVYYCAIKRQHLRRAVDVLCDIVFQSQYPQQEVEKEREVVCDEIESYEDSPAELIYDDIENVLFQGHPLGHNILGTTAQLHRYSSEDARRFTSRYYRPDNCVFFASGDVDFKQLLKQLASMEVPAGTTLPGEPIVATEPIAPAAAATITRHRSTHQAHVMLGTQAFAATDDRRWALYLLNNILGGPGMNSRLCLSLRERRGLVYTVESTLQSYSDTGMWCVYFGCDQTDVRRCLRLVRSELARLARKPLTASQLRAAKQQIEGQLAIAADSREQFALDFARNYLHHGTERDLNDIMAHINALTAEELQQTAALIFGQERLTTLIYD
jgi:predicted Zn-dependent peptidase